MSSGLLDVAISSISKVSQELEAVAMDSVYENQGLLIAKNTGNLFAGKNANNQRLDEIGGEYKPFTIEMKKAKGQPYNRVTLFDTGAFYSGFFVKVFDRGWELNSRDPKRNKLKNRWGEDIFGNTQADEKEFNKNTVLPDLLEHALNNIEL